MSKRSFWLLIFGIIFVSLLAVWLGGALYLRSIASVVLYQTECSKNEDKTWPDGIFCERDFTLNSKREKIEILIVRKHENYRSEGAEAILYLHGTHGRVQSILEDASQVAPVFSPAYPGYSRSEGKPSEENIYETTMKTLEYLLFRRQYSPNQITVLGHSLGAAAALQTASIIPNLRRVVLVNAFYSMQAMCQTKYSLWCIFTGDLFNNAVVAPWARAKIRQFHVRQDDYVPFEQGQKLFAKIGSADKVFQGIEGTHDNFDVARVLRD